MNNQLGVSPSKGNQGITRGKEQICEDCLFVCLFLFIIFFLLCLFVYFFHFFFEKRGSTSPWHVGAYAISKTIYTFLYDKVKYSSSMQL